MLLALELSLDIPWLRICFFAGYFFVGLFLKRALTVGAIGSAFGLPAALVNDIARHHPSQRRGGSRVHALAVVVWDARARDQHGRPAPAVSGKSSFIAPPELDTRLQAVELALRRQAGQISEEPSTPLRTLATAGMTRPAALLKTASLVNPWVRARHESLAALVTLADRLVTAARALEALASSAVTADEAARLRRAADGGAAAARPAGMAAAWARAVG